MAIMQRDELGLLSGRVLAKLGLLGGNSSQPPKPAREQQRRQQHAQQCTVQEAGEEGEESFGEPSSSLSWQGEEVVEVDLQHHDLRLGRSPDSDDLASTGSQLMEAFHEGPCANGGTCPRDGVRLQATTQQYSSSEKHEGCSSSGQQCGMAHLAGDQQQEAQAGILEGSTGPHYQQQQQQQQQQEQGNTPTVDGPVSQQAVDAYSLPEHAQVAALLGQPTSGCLSVGSNSKPFRSPFVSELLHHSHPPGPLEAQQKQAGNLAAASGMLVADALALQRVAPAPSASNETFWLRDDGHAGGNGSGSYSAISRLPFSIRNAPLLRMIPKYYGVAAHDEQRTLLELEDLARAYRHPCIIDIKVGFRTWYPHAEERYIQRCRGKDASTTQAALGFKICGMQVFRHGAGGYWRASKRWCKTLPVELVDKALLSFAHNDHGLRPADVYGGAAGAIAQLEALEAWFSVQQDFHFYSSSVLLLYEGDANCEEEAKVGVRMVDFAHTFQSEGRGRDTNFLAGLRALLARLRAVVHSTVAHDLAAV